MVIKIMTKASSHQDVCAMPSYVQYILQYVQNARKTWRCSSILGEVYNMCAVSQGSHARHLVLCRYI